MIQIFENVMVKKCFPRNKGRIFLEFLLLPTLKKTGVKCTPTVKSRFSLVSSGFAGDVKIHHHSS